MHLARIDIQGFKTFANKTTLSFLPPKNGRYPLTAIVGPNGSGKSNAADAIRWAMGEQSLKLLRGKDSTDVIFSGSSARGRAGVCEVTLTFDNHDNVFPLDASEVSVTRRLYRDGTSEYLVNGTASRLQDLQLMLAEAGVGQRSYSIVGQGLVDAVLNASPEERKGFFDDATGVRPFQMKRHQAMLKLRRTYENLAETEMILRELEPRLRLLSRQTRRLEERGEIERELSVRQHIYYGTLWHHLSAELHEAQRNVTRIEVDIARQQEAMRKLEGSLTAIEKASRGEVSDGLASLQQNLRETEKKNREATERVFELQKEIELSRVRAQSRWAPLPLADIVRELGSITERQKESVQKLKKIKNMEELHALLPEIDRTSEDAMHLRKRLERPAPEEFEADPEALKALKVAETAQKEAQEKRRALEGKMDAYAKKEQAERTELFDIERKLREAQRELHPLEQSRGESRINLARLEERLSGLAREMESKLKDRADSVKLHAPKTPLPEKDWESTHTELERLSYKLELIGGIDPEIVKEHEETKTRFEFLDTHVKDLRSAMKDSERVIDELDLRIEKQSSETFKKIQTEFQRYFKVLFGGGTCSLVKLTREELPEDKAASHDEEEAREGDISEELKEVDSEALSELEGRIRLRDRIAGIDINATPPGKKLKSLNLLSGGERALTSIALLAAIMASNPSPFVVLDEVDAALDEANTMRFAAILDELRENTQYIVITHNRATMEKADVLYGVTMAEEGVSQLLSVNVEDIAQDGTARR